MVVEWTEGIKLKILNQNPAIGFVLLHIPIVKTELPFPALTNGKVILVNDSCIQEIEKNENLNPKRFRTRLLEHEVLHIILKHEERYNKLKGKNKLYWNISGDVVINSLMLKEQDIIEIETNLTNLQRKKLLVEFSVEDLETEKVYNALTKSAEKIGGSGGGSGESGEPDEEEKDKESDEGSDGEGSDENEEEDENGEGEGKGDEEIEEKLKSYSPDLTDTETDKDEEFSQNAKKEGFSELKDYVKSLLAQGIMISKIAGKGRGDLIEMLEELIEKKRNWHGVLKNVMSEKVADNGHDITYSRPHRRFYTTPSFEKNGFIIPARLKTNLDKVVVAIDSSGSIDDNKYRKFGSDLLGLVKNFKMDGWMVFFDDGISRKYPLNRLNRNQVKTIFKNRTDGGTDLTDVFVFAEKIRAKVLLIFTDTEAHYPERIRWNFKTLFLTYDKDYNKTANKFGAVVVLDFKEGEKYE
jgi:predicted metal-dependent peptidase